MIKQAYFLEKLAKEMDTMKLDVTDGNDIDLVVEEEEIPPLPEKVLLEKPLTFEEKESQSIYESAVLMLNKTKPDKKKAYSLLLDAAGKGNVEAKALIAWAKLFGNPLKQDLQEAKNIFNYLADLGNPDGHMGLGKF